jgi:hypothetical protein
MLNLCSNSFGFLKEDYKSLLNTYKENDRQTHPGAGPILTLGLFFLQTWMTLTSQISKLYLFGFFNC